MKILIIEDDANISSLLNRGFSECGYFVECCIDGCEGEYLALTCKYDLIILDWMLPNKNGLVILENLRQKNIKTPIIMLTAKNEISDKVLGLTKGSDDYLSKPFSFIELKARVDAIYRRSISSGKNIINLDNISIDIDSKVLTKDNIEINLTKKEYDLLLFLIKHKNAIVSNNMIEEQLWSHEEYINSNVIQVTMYHLRRKIGKNLIKSYRGLGYKVEF